MAVLDLRTARPGRRLFHLTPEQVRAPFGVDVMQVNPSTIAMVFEPSGSRQVPVVPSLDGKPAPGYVVGRVTTEPETVEIVGPRSAVVRAAEAITEPVDISGAAHPVTETVTVGLLDPSLRLKTPRAATVVVQVVPGSEERTLQRQPVHLRGLGPQLSAEAIPNTVDVMLRGSREALSDVREASAYVDVSGLGVGDYTLPVRADASPEAGVTHVDPPTVLVRVTHAK